MARFAHFCVGRHLVTSNPSVKMVNRHPSTACSSITDMPATVALIGGRRRGRPSRAQRRGTLSIHRTFTTATNSVIACWA
jgi:hypothetical protein